MEHGVDQGMIRILYIGTFPPPEGGVRVGVRLLADELAERSDVELDVIDISTRVPHLRRIPFYLNALFRIVGQARRADVLTFTAPTNYTPMFGTMLFVISRLLGKPLVIRNTAGHNHRLYKKMGPLGRLLMRRAPLRADLNLYQTQEQTDYFRRLGLGPVKAFPNHRKAPDVQDVRRADVATRFVFVGRIGVEKGVDVLVDAFRGLDAGLELDLYGEDCMDIESVVRDVPNVAYRGLVEHRLIFQVLSGYDALVLPSVLEGEGHPGVVVEAFLVGLPVIATSLTSICEIVEDEKNGLLVGPGRSDELRAAVLRLSRDAGLYGRLRKFVENHQEEFTSGYWSDIFAEECRALVVRQAG